MQTSINDNKIKDLTKVIFLKSFYLTKGCLILVLKWMFTAFSDRLGPTDDLTTWC